MKLVVIYGAPATGKLTVANQLSKLTKFKIFHNHLTVDLLSSLLKFGTESYFKFSDKVRLELMEQAATSGVKGVIFTFCYAFPSDNKWIKKLIGRIEKHNSKVHFVHLCADQKELHKRVKHASRENFGKLKTRKGLTACLKKWDFYTSIPFVKSLRIDNTDISAKKVATKIKKHYKL